MGAFFLAQTYSITSDIGTAIERNRYDPSLELAFALAEHFECAIEDIFDPVEIDP
ncbi:helix-turn-helix transcriptional regulator [Halorhabdus rudnickae]|uniref:helix-turn-helix transcriptional regulator n=1 Tax=Halorhabdus rudnickae TaxID=1775544 RepID=UPI001FCE6AF5|nr:transcriptional regulator [Halorhabdus rudnickae]